MTDDEIIKSFESSIYPKGENNTFALLVLMKRAREDERNKIHKDLLRIVDKGEYEYIRRDDIEWYFDRVVF